MIARRWQPNMIIEGWQPDMITGGYKPSKSKKATDHV